MKKLVCILTALLLQTGIVLAQKSIEQTLIDAARGFLSEQKFDLAIEYISKAIAISPKSYDAWDVRGLSYTYKDEKSLALQVIRLEPGYAQAYMGRAYVHLTNGRIDLAIADQTEAIRISQKVEYFHSRESDYRNSGQFKLSVPDLSEAIRLDPANWGYYHSRALSYLETSEHSLAIKDL